jgi:hypothetical protein
LKLNGTHQLLVYADDVNILGGSIHAVKEKAEALIVTSKEIGLEVNAERTKYMVMSRDQNTGRSRSMKTDNSSFERVEEFKYLGTTSTNQNSFSGFHRVSLLLVTFINQLMHSINTVVDVKSV